MPWREPPRRWRASEDRSPVRPHHRRAFRPAARPERPHRASGAGTAVPAGRSGPAPSAGGGGRRGEPAHVPGLPSAGPGRERSALRCSGRPLDGAQRRSTRQSATRWGRSSTISRTSAGRPRSHSRSMITASSSPNRRIPCSLKRTVRRRTLPLSTITDRVSRWFIAGPKTSGRQGSNCWESVPHARVPRPAAWSAGQDGPEQRRTPYGAKAERSISTICDSRHAPRSEWIRRAPSWRRRCCDPPALPPACPGSAAQPRRAAPCAAISPPATIGRK